MTVPIFLYWSETWVSKIQAKEVKVLRSVKGCTRLDIIKILQIQKELNICSVNWETDN
jgi:hypothetical protein